MAKWIPVDWSETYGVTLTSYRKQKTLLAVTAWSNDQKAHKHTHTHTPGTPEKLSFLIAVGAET